MRPFTGIFWVKGEPMTERTNDRKSLLMLTASMLIFGTIGVFRHYIPLSSALLAFFRGTLGSLFLVAFVAVRHKGSREKLPLRMLLALCGSGAMIGVNWMLLFEAYNHTTVAVATLCYYMQPTIVMLLSPLLFREALTRRKAACAAASVLGMVLVSDVIGSGGLRGGDLRGILLGLGAAALYAGVVIMNKRIRGVDPYLKTTVQLLSAGIAMFPYLLATGGFVGKAFSPAAVLLVLVVGIVHTGLAYALYFGSMEGLRVQSIAVLSYIDPVCAVLFSALLLRESLSPLQAVGAVLILGSALAAERRPAGR